MEEESRGATPTNQSSTPNQNSSMDEKAIIDKGFLQVMVNSLSHDDGKIETIHSTSDACSNLRWRAQKKHLGRVETLQLKSAFINFDKSKDLSSVINDTIDSYRTFEVKGATLSERHRRR